jgi:hypothetical protein
MILRLLFKQPFFISNDFLLLRTEYWHLYNVGMLNPDITYFARTNFRNQNKLFGIRQ